MSNRDCLFHTFGDILPIIIRNTIGDVNNDRGGIVGLILHPLFNNGFSHFERALHLGCTVLSNGLDPNRHRIINLDDTTGTIRLLLLQGFNAERIGIKLFQVSRVKLFDIVVVADNRNETTILRAFAVKVLLDDGINNSVNCLRSKNSFRVVAIILGKH